MRIVIYDAEDMEPITVIALGSWADPYLADIERGRRVPVLNIPIMPRMKSMADDHPVGPVPTHRTICRLKFDPIWRNESGRKQRMMWLCTTIDGESALLLRSTFLPGQQAAVNEEREKAFTAGLMAAMGVR